MIPTSNDIEDAIRLVVGDAFAQPGFYPDERPSFPYINFMPFDAETRYANDVAWFRWLTYDIVLCTRHRSKALEKELLDALASRGIEPKGVNWTPDFDEGVLYFEVLTGPVQEIIDEETEVGNG